MTALESILKATKYARQAEARFQGRRQAGLPMRKWEAAEIAVRRAVVALHEACDALTEVSK
jgi:hypothetical protein